MTESLLSEFSNEDRDLVIRTPYRVGMWLSQVDTTGGAQSAGAEHAAIESVIIGYAQDYLKSEFVQRVMEQVVAQRGHWPYWTYQLPSVPDECRRVVALLGGRIPPADVASYKHNLMNIAIAVAMAFTEGKSDLDKTFLSDVIDFLRALMGAVPLPEREISNLEQKALEQLASVLGLALDDLLAA